MQLFEKDAISRFQLLQLVLWYIHFSLAFVCFLCPCFRLATFHLLALLANSRTDNT